jgi:hypothetical protein
MFSTYPTVCFGTESVSCRSMEDAMIIIQIQLYCLLYFAPQFGFNNQNGPPQCQLKLVTNEV